MSELALPSQASQLHHTQALHNYHQFRQLNFWTQKRKKKSCDRLGQETQYFWLDTYIDFIITADFYWCQFNLY